MIITGRRIRKVDKYLGFLEEGSTIVIGINNPGNYPEILGRIGFTTIEAGYSVLPSASLGNISKFNAEGGAIQHKDRPKETIWRMINWEREEWRGRYDTETVIDVISRRYKRYPITPIPPPSVELSLQYKTSGDLVLTSPPSDYREDQRKAILHKINLFLEIFDECYIFSEDLNEIINAPTRRLNWRILPPGPMPWDELHGELERVINMAPEEKRAVAEYRLREINEYGPEQVAVGTAGFNGYIILGFESKDIFVCESLWYGNATYIFGEDWEELSQMTKADILRNDLHQERIVHHKNRWRRRIRELLS